jgi:hypothetical protein
MSACLFIEMTSRFICVYFPEAFAATFVFSK